MQIIFAGAEVSSHRTILNAAGVKAISIDYRLLKNRGLPKKSWLISERVPDDVAVYVSCNTEEQDSRELGEHDLGVLVGEYARFCELNAPRIAGAVDVSLPGVPGVSCLVPILGVDKVWPVFHGVKHQSLETFANRFSHIALPGSVIEEDSTLAGHTRAVSGIYKTTWHAIAHARPDDLRSLPLATVTTLSWLAPMLRGETVVWDGVRLVRYPKRMKDQARVRLGSVCERAGLDYELVKADDNKEVTRLAIWSYLQMQDAMNGGHVPEVVDNKPYRDEPGSAETGVLDVDSRVVDVRKPNIPLKRPVAEQMTLPVMDFEQKQVVDYEDGRQIFRTVPVAQSNPGTIRQCNTCFVAASCPAFQADHACAFSLPVEVKTRDQLLSLLQAMIEIQAQRVAFGRFAEELNGGYADPNISAEMDRLFRMVEKLKGIQENREFIQITAQRNSGAGILSSIFGEKAAQLKELPNGGFDENTTTRIISQTLEG